MSVGGLLLPVQFGDKSCCSSKWLFLLLHSRGYRTWSWLWKVQSMIWYSIVSRGWYLSIFHTVGCSTGGPFYILRKGSLLYWNFILTEINLSPTSYKFFDIWFLQNDLVHSYCRNKSYVSVQFFPLFFHIRICPTYIPTWRKMPCVNPAIAMLLKLPPRTLAVLSARRHQAAAADLTGPRARKCMPSIPVMPTVMWFVGVAVISYHKTTRVIAALEPTSALSPSHSIMLRQYLKFICSYTWDRNVFSG